MSTSACELSTGVCSQGCPGGLGFAPVRARGGGGADAWVAGVLAAPGAQVSWQLGPQKYSALEGCGTQDWPICSSILAWRTPLPGREVWQAPVSSVAESDTTGVTLRAQMQDLFGPWQLCPSES